MLVPSALIESREWMKKAMAVILTGHEKAWGTEMLVPVGTGKAYLERGILWRKRKVPWLWKIM